MVNKKVEWTDAALKAFEVAQDLSDQAYEYFEGTAQTGVNLREAEVVAKIAAVEALIGIGKTLFDIHEVLLFNSPWGNRT